MSELSPVERLKPVYEHPDFVDAYGRLVNPRKYKIKGVDPISEAKAEAQVNQTRVRHLLAVEPLLEVAHADWPANHIKHLLGKGMGEFLMLHGVDGAPSALGPEVEIEHYLTRLNEYAKKDEGFLHDVTPQGMGGKKALEQLAIARRHALQAASVARAIRLLKDAYFDGPVEKAEMKAKPDETLHAQAKALLASSGLKFTNPTSGKTLDADAFLRIVEARLSNTHAQLKTWHQPGQYDDAKTV